LGSAAEGVRREKRNEEPITMGRQFLKILCPTFNLKKKNWIKRTMLVKQGEKKVLEERNCRRGRLRGFNSKV